MDRPWGERIVREYAAEVAATVPDGPDPGWYTDTLVRRFANHAMRHRLRQIAMDGSLKLPERWLAALRELRAAGRDAPVLEATLAAWAGHTRDDVPDDPAADRLRAAWPGRRDAEAVRELLLVLGASDLADDTALVTAVAGRLVSTR